MRTPDDSTELAEDERRKVMRERVASWAQRLNVQPRQVRVQRMTRKWGSCSTTGVVTLAADLADQDVGFQDFVIVHELLHLRVPNHGKLFKALLTAHVPDWKSYSNPQMNADRRRIRGTRRFTAWPQRTPSAHQCQTPHRNKRIRH